MDSDVLCHLLLLPILLFSAFTFCFSGLIFTLAFVCLPRLPHLPFTIAFFSAASVYLSFGRVGKVGRLNLIEESRLLSLYIVQCLLKRSEQRENMIHYIEMLSFHLLVSIVLSRCWQSAKSLTLCSAQVFLSYLRTWGDKGVEKTWRLYLPLGK